MQLFIHYVYLPSSTIHEYGRGFFCFDGRRLVFLSSGLLLGLGSVFDFFFTDLW